MLRLFSSGGHWENCAAGQRDMEERIRRIFVIHHRNAQNMVRVLECLLKLAAGRTVDLDTFFCQKYNRVKYFEKIALFSFNHAAHFKEESKS